MEQYSKIQDQLKSGKVSQRKEGLKQLNLLLDSESAFASISGRTACIKDSEPIPEDSWPGMCKALIAFHKVSSRVTATDSLSQVKMLRRVLQNAEDPRAGAPLSLLRVAAGLFEHISQLLQAADLVSSIGLECSTILRTLLLPVPEYCVQASSGAFHDMLEAHLGELLKVDLGRGEEAYRLAVTAQLLVQHFPGSIEPDCRRELAVAFCEIIDKLNQRREDGRLMLVIMSCLNMYLQNHGLDICSVSNEIHGRLHLCLMRVWAASRDTRLHDAMLTYFRIQMRLQALDHHLNDLQQLLEAEISKPGFQWGEGECLLLPAMQYAHADLLSSVLHRNKSLSSANASSHSNLHNSKRRKVSSQPPLAALASSAMQSPQQWAPVAGMLLHQHADSLSVGTLISWLSIITPAFQQPAAYLAPEQVSSKAGLSSAVWLCRLVRELAASWPAVLCRPCDEGVAAADDARLTLAELWRRWKELWDALLGCLDLQCQSLLHDEALMALAAIANRRCVGHVTRLQSRSIWDKGPLQHCLSPAGLHFCAALFGRDGSAAQDEACWRSNILDRVIPLEPLPAAEYMPDLRASAVSALLALPASAQPSATDACLCPWWQADIMSSSMEAALNQLQRGAAWAEEAMFRAKQVSQMVQPPSISGSALSLSTRRQLCLHAAELLASGLTKMSSVDAPPSLLLDLQLGMLSTVRSCLQGLAQSKSPDAQQSQQELDNLHGALSHALQLCNKHILACCTSSGVLLPATLQQWQRVLTTSSSLSPQGAELLQACQLAQLVSKIKQAFMDALNISGSSQRHAHSRTASEDMLDADLDFLPSTSFRAAASTARPAAYAQSPDKQLALVRVLHALSAVPSEEAGAALADLAEQCQSAASQPPSQILQELAAALCTAYSHGAVAVLLPACAAIGQEKGMLMGKLHRASAQAALEQLEVLLKAMQSAEPAHGTDEARQQVLAIWQHLISQIHAHEQRLQGFTTWQMRRQMAACAAAVLHARLDCIPADIEDCNGLILNLAEDVSFQGRRALAALLPSLHTVWTLAQYLIVEDRVKLGGKDPSTTPMEMFETSVIIMGEAAVGSLALERDALLLLCRHALHVPEHFNLVQSAAHVIASRNGFPSMPAFIQQHVLGFLSDWVMNGCTMQELIAVQAILDPSADVKSAVPALINTYAHELVAVLLINDQSAQVKELAELLGMPLVQLLEKAFPTILGIVFPYCETQDAADKELAQDVLHNGIFPEQLGGQTAVEARLHEHFVAITGQMLLLAEAGRNAYKPNFNILVVIRALGSFTGQADLASRQSALNQNLDDDSIAALLLRMHQHLENASSPPHRAAALTPLRVMLQVLESRVLVPATFRYASKILLSQLRHRDMQEECCKELTELLLLCYDSPSDAERLTPILSSILSFAINSFESNTSLLTAAPHLDIRLAVPVKQQEAGRRALAGLIDLLTLKAPSALVECLHDVEMPPDVPLLRPAREFLLRIHESYSLAERLEVFAERAASMPVALRQQSLITLAAAVQADRNGLLHLPGQSGTSGQHAGMGQPVCSQKVASAAWQLTWLASELHDDALAAFAGALLGEVGPLDAPTIVFSRQHAGSAQTRPVSTSRPARGMPRSASDSSCTQSMLAAILPVLADCLIDSDTAVIQSAQRTARKLLSLPDSISALQRLPEATQLSLMIFQKGDVDEVSNQPQAVNVQPILQAVLWQPLADRHEEWVCKLACALLQCTAHPALRELRRIVRWKATLAELVLPFAFMDLASGHIDTETNEAISEHIQQHIFHMQQDSLQAKRLLLSVLEFLRSQHLAACRAMLQPDSNSLYANWHKVYWLNVDYHAVAQAALQCSQCLTALLYLEQWCEERHGRLVLGDAELLSEGPAPAEDQLLLSIYSQLTEPDGIYAAVRSRKLASQLHLFQHEGSWPKVLLACDLLLRDPWKPDASLQGAAAERTQQNLGLHNALQQFGCLHTAAALSRMAEQPDTAGLQDARCESAWRMGQWSDILPDSSSENISDSFHRALCSILKAIQQGDEEACASLVRGSRTSLVHAISATSSESTASINPAVVKLQMLTMLAEAWDLQWHKQLSVLPGSDCHNSQSSQLMHELEEQQLRARWQIRSSAAGAGGRFELQEPLLKVQQVVMESLALPSTAAEALLHAAAGARKSQQLLQSMAAIHEMHAMLQRLQSSVGADAALLAELQSPAAGWRVEEAKLLWAQGQSSMALRLVQAMIAQLDTIPRATGDISAVHSRLLTLSGKWLAHTRSDSPGAILQAQQRAMDILLEQTAGNSAGVTACRAAFRLATYSDSLYNGLQAQRASPEYRVARAIVAQKQHQVAELTLALQQRVSRLPASKRAQPGQADAECRSVRAHMLQLQRAIDNDQIEDQLLESNICKFRQIALTNFRRALLAGSNYDLQVVFRVCQLWFSQNSEEDINAQLSSTFETVSSHKFLPLVYQIASRINALPLGHLVRDEVDFQDTLRALLLRLAVDHPHHVLPQLLALSHGDLGRNGKPELPGNNVLRQQVDHDKITAARDLLRLIGQHADRKEVVAQYGHMVDIYVQLAAVPAGAEATMMTFPSTLRRSAQALPLVPVISWHLPVDPSAAYAALPHFTGFGDRISFVGGVNKPKVVLCHDSSGRQHRQLVKSGNDDMRQDAVMQQFFALVNSFLQASAPTRKRQLHITTYKVVPFSPCAGLLQWVENTLPIIDWLAGDRRVSGAHVRYAPPGGCTFSDCFHTMQAAKRGELREKFDQICERFPPCLHKFFLEEWHTPADWFQHRLTYTRSTAANSMAGYIIGLGDRHLSNILINRSTAEVVHIDLGIAFEQGRLLNTPELVPFRLTRDVVDGFGVTGTDGVMRRCCEEVLKVLRSHTDIFLTIIQVFIHDPLYRMGLSATTANHQQLGSLSALTLEAADGHEAGPAAAPLANADAERTVLRCRQKLQGRDQGEGEARGVEGQVQQLFHDAQNHDNLCRMYVGWAAFL